MKTYNTREERDAQVASGKICPRCFRVKCKNFKAGVNIVQAKAEAK